MTIIQKDDINVKMSNSKKWLKKKWETQKSDRNFILKSDKFKKKITKKK